MSTIIAKLNNALNIKNEYLTPNNIREGVNIFGVTGNVHEGPNLAGLTLNETYDLISNSNCFNYSYGIMPIPTNGLTYTGGPLLNYNYYNYENNCRVLLRTITNMDTSTVTSFDGMFQSWTNLVEIPNFNTSRGVSFSSTFAYCYNLTNIANIDVSKGKYFSRMLEYCKNLKELPESFNNLTNESILSCDLMFEGCENLNYIPNINTKLVSNFYGMFSGCSNLNELPNIDISNGYDLSYMFNGCSINDFPNINIGNAYNISGMFSSTNISNLNNFNYNLNNANGFYSLFYNCLNLNGNVDFKADLKFNRLGDFGHMFYRTNISSVIVDNFIDNTRDTSFYYTFSDAHNLTDFTISNITTNRYINFYNFLYNDYNVTNVKFDNCNFSGGYNFANMLYNIGSNLKELSFTNCRLNSGGGFYAFWYYNNVGLNNAVIMFKDTLFENSEYIQPAFAYSDISKMTNVELVIDNLTFNNITRSIDRPFEGLNLVNLSVNQFKITNCSYASSIFSYSPYLVNFSGNIYVDNVSYISSMFAGCNNLSNESVLNIVNMCINWNVSYKNLSNANQYSPFYSTKYDNSYYTELWDDLNNAGWSY